MSQHAQAIKTKNYSLAGTQLHPFERIVVSSTVDIPDAVSEDENSRVLYRSEKNAVRSRLGISLPWALLLIMLTVVIMSMIWVNKSQQRKALKVDFAHLQSQYTASEQERLLLADQLDSAKDSNFICYYASQNLGMKLALHEETIRVAAPGGEAYQQFAGMYWNAASNKH